MGPMSCRTGILSAGRFAAWALRPVFPGRCELCGRWEWETDWCGENALLCQACSAALARARRIGTENICMACGEPLFSGAWHDDQPGICSACIVHPLPLRYLRSIYWYGGVPEELIKRFKYGNRRRIGRIFAQEMRCFISSRAMPWTQWELIIPLPSAPGSLIARSYSHTGLVARDLAKSLGISASMLALRSSRQRLRQVELSARERRINLQDAFTAVRQLVEGRRILVVDDVVTTGASLHAAGAELISAGAKSVDALTVARSLESSLVRCSVAAR